MNKLTTDTDDQLTKRKDELLNQYQDKRHRSTSKLFLLLLPLQWLYAVCVSILWSPLAWNGSQSYLHEHVIIAIFFGFVLTAFPMYLLWNAPEKAYTRHITAVAQVVFSSLLIHLTGGRIETHFHIFASLAFLAVYRDIPILITATIIVAIDHLLRGIYWPQSVYGVIAATPWRTLEHALWVLFEDIFLFIAIKQSHAEMNKICESQASQENTQRQIEDEVALRTQEIKNIKLALDEHSIVSIANVEGRITFVNDKFCEVSKYSREELLGQDHKIVNSGYHSKDFIRDIWRTIAQGESWQGEICNRAKDGSLYWVQSTIVPFLNAKGKPYQYVSIRTDITEKKQTEVALIRSNEDITHSNSELSEFAYVVSHDLKAPLRGISSIATFLTEDYRDKLGPDGTAQLELLRNRVGRMNSLINGVLQYSKIGRDKSEVSTFCLDSLVDEIIDSLSPPAHFLLTRENSLPGISAEQIKIRQVFQNLISNAIKYNNKSEPKISIGSKMVNGQEHFYVKDNGPGIEEKYHAKVFQLFQTLECKDEFESTGVGLSLVKKIIEGYSGSIWIDSIPGEETTFWFTLPGAIVSNVSHAAIPSIDAPIDAFS